MNNKGQTVGVLITIAIALIVGSVLLAGTGGIAAESARLTTLNEVQNATITLPNTAGGRVDLVGQNIHSIIVTNATGATKLAAGNYTIYNNVILTNGDLGAQIGNAQLPSPWNNTIVNVTYVYEPLGYVSDAASRSMVGLIVVFACIALLIISIWPIMSSKILDVVGR